MRSSYKKSLALPPKVSFMVLWQEDHQVNQFAVDNFVSNLKRPSWYKDTEDESKDTRAFLLSYHMKEGLTKTITDPFTGNTAVMWQCASCKCGVTYGGIDLGHIEDWRSHLKKAGVRTEAEAKAAYNNLANLRIECATCNRSHDFEEENM